MLCVSDFYLNIFGKITIISYCRCKGDALLLNLLFFIVVDFPLHILLMKQAPTNWTNTIPHVFQPVFGERMPVLQLAYNCVLECQCLPAILYANYQSFVIYFIFTMIQVFYSICRNIFYILLPETKKNV